MSLFVFVGYLVQSMVSLLNATDNNKTIPGLRALKVPPTKPIKSGARFVCLFYLMTSSQLHWLYSTK